MFPVIEHLDEVLAAVGGREEFMVHRNEALGFVSVLYRYVMSDTFPDPAENGIGAGERLRRQLLRECRGITFDAASGAVIGRKFHKFFGLAEKEETQPHRIDWSLPHLRLVKADGSLMTPLVLGGRVRWASKMGVTRVSAPVEAYTDALPAYQRLAHAAHAMGVTPLFEWCSSEAQRIILDYPEAPLVLLAVRGNVTGRYWHQDEVEALAREHGVPVIGRAGGTVPDHAAYLRELAGLTGIEGEVIVFESGERYKVKTDEYRRMHVALAGLTQEKDVLALVLAEGIDDVKPLVTPDIAGRLDAFSDAVNRGLDASGAALADLFLEGHRNFGGDRKRFATEFAKKQPDAALLFALWDRASDGGDALRIAARDLVAQLVGKNLASATRVDGVRRLFGGGDVRWTAEIPDLDA